MEILSDNILCRVCEILIFSNFGFFVNFVFGLFVILDEGFIWDLVLFVFSVIWDLMMMIDVVLCKM